MSKKKKESLKRIVAMACAALVVVALVASFLLPIAYAATQQQIDNANAKTEQAKKDAEEAEKRKNEAIAEYEAIDAQISSAEDELDRIENEIEQTKSDIALKEAELEVAQAEQEKHESAFMARARAMYKHSEIKYVEILFSADSFSDFLSKIDMITKIMEYDNQILEDLIETKEKIDNAKTELEESLALLEENEAKVVEQRASLEETLAEKQRIMEAAISDSEKYKAIYEHAEREEEALINNNIDGFRGGGEYSGEGFTWPVPGSGRITSKYGNRIHPVYNTLKFHSGIDIGAGYGLDIVAASSGTVTLSTTNGGYGKCIVINHGDGITTLYGHCSTLLVSQGDKVTKGQVIAKVGSTGVSTGPHLHFEVRINGATTNPENYVRPGVSK